MVEQQRYMRLQHLLQKSSIYSKFLLQRMESQIEEKKKNEKKSERRKKIVQEEGQQANTEKVLTSLDKFCYVIVKHCTNSLVHLCNCCLCVCLLIVCCCKCSNGTRGVLTLSNVNKVRKR